MAVAGSVVAQTCFTWARGLTADSLPGMLSLSCCGLMITRAFGGVIKCRALPTPAPSGAIPISGAAYQTKQ